MLVAYYHGQHKQFQEMFNEGRDARTPRERVRCPATGFALHSNDGSPIVRGTVRRCGGMRDTDRRPVDGVRSGNGRERSLRPPPATTAP